MPIKKDETGKRWVEMNLLVPGTPEQVWAALATGPGYAGWFIKAEVEPRVGGKLVFHFGGGVASPGEVTEWSPPHKFGYVERDWDKDAPPVATEITIVARSGDRCQVRMVHSLFSSEDSWDDQLEGFESGWVSALEVLRIYLLHFAGVPAATFMSITPSKADAPTSWKQLTEAFGMSGANVGDRCSSSAGPEAFSGVVEHVHQDAKQRFTILRVEQPAPGLTAIGTYDKGNGAPPNVAICRYFYGDQAEQQLEKHEPAWREWFQQTFGSDEEKAG